MVAVHGGPDAVIAAASLEGARQCIEKTVIAVQTMVANRFQMPYGSGNVRSSQALRTPVLDKGFRCKGGKRVVLHKKSRAVIHITSLTKKRLSAARTVTNKLYPSVIGP